MKHITAIVALLFFFLALAAYPAPQAPMPDQYGFVVPLSQPERDYRLSSFYGYSWQDYWKPTSRTLYTYNLTNPQIEETAYFMQDDEWIYSNKTDSYLNTQGLTFLTRNLFWYIQAWQENSCTLMEYNAAGQITESRIYYWWQSESEHSDLVSYAVYSYLDGLLSNYYMEYYFESEILFFLSNDYIYNDQGLLTQIDFSTHNNSTDSANNTRAIYNYNPQSLIQTVTYYVCEDNIWSPYSRYHYSYDEFDRLSVLLLQPYASDGQDFEDYLRTLYSYNAQGLKSEELYQLYEYSTWINNSKTVYNYEYLATDEQIHSPVRFSFGPNPFTDRINLSFSLKETQNTQLKIYDIRGRLVHSEELGHLTAGNHEIQYDLNAYNREKLASGIYLLRLKTGDQLSTRKALKIK